MLRSGGSTGGAAPGPQQRRRGPSGATRALVAFIAAAAVGGMLVAAPGWPWRGGPASGVTVEQARALERLTADALDRVAELKLELLDALDAGSAGPGSGREAEAGAEGERERRRGQEPYLLVAMPTVARSEDTLGRVLRALDTQLAPDDPSTAVTVMDVGDGPHPAFDAARARYPRFSFVRRPGPDAEPPPVPNDTRFHPPPPPAIVRRQTRDFVALLRSVAGESRYLLLVEDDFICCPTCLAAVRHLVGKLRRTRPDWLAATVSYGMNGILLQNSARGGGADVRALADYLMKRHHHRPPDHIYTEWACGESEASARYAAGRAHVAFRYNLLHHAGARSSTLGHPAVSHAKCFEELVEPVLFAVQAFRPAECGHDDVQPCRPRGEAAAEDARFVDAPYRPPLGW